MWTWLKRRPFFILHAFALLNDICAYITWFWKQTNKNKTKTKKKKKKKKKNNTTLIRSYVIFFFFNEDDIQIQVVPGHSVWFQFKLACSQIGALFEQRPTPETKTYYLCIPVQVHRLCDRLHDGSCKPGRLAWLLPRAVRQVNWPFHCKLKYVIWKTEIQIFFNEISKFPIMYANSINFNIFQWKQLVFLHQKGTWNFCAWWTLKSTIKTRSST